MYIMIYINTSICFFAHTFAVQTIKTWIMPQKRNISNHRNQTTTYAIGKNDKLNTNSTANPWQVTDKSNEIFTLIKIFIIGSMISSVLYLSYNSGKLFFTELILCSSIVTMLLIIKHANK